MYMSYISFQLMLQRESVTEMGKGEESSKADQQEELEEDQRATVEVWKYILGFTDMAVVKCAIELGVADEIERQGGAATLSQLSTALSCSPPLLYRIMRFLVHRRVFKSRPAAADREATTNYLQTPLSRRLLQGGEKSMAAFILYETTPAMLAPWHGLSALVSTKGTVRPPFEAVHGQDVWMYSAGNPEHSRLHDEALACEARLAAAAVIGGFPEVFEGLGVVVDVGGGNGTFVGMLVKALPHIKGINFDLPHVISVAPHWDGVEQVGGDMFESIPKADAAILLRVLHDWSDSECVRILEKCREAIARDDDDSRTGSSDGKQIGMKKIKKVIILEAVVDDNDDQGEEEEEGWKGVKLSLDMATMAHTGGGKERTRSEWASVLAEARFSSFTIKPTSNVQSVIECFP